MLESVAHRVWHGDDVLARIARSALMPAEWVFAAAVARRNARFDRVAAASSRRARPLAALSVGNLTVGGTGKTPIAAWCIAQLRERGARPAVIMRGYGDDEWRVHALLNPGVDVIVTPDRSSGLVSAASRGADCAVLDDAFQHRRAPRVADLVLVSVDSWSGRVRLLPAGPFREGLDALRRASVVVLTRKNEALQPGGLLEAIARHAPGVPVAQVRIVPREVRLATADLPAAGRAPRPAVDRTGFLAHPVSWLSGRRIVAVSAIGDPAAFESQLEARGATLSARLRFRDHHGFSAADAARMARHASGTDGVVCTLKDAVKLAPVWPREAAPLWYVSQSVVIERGAEALNGALARVLAARATTPTTR